MVFPTHQYDTNIFRNPWLKNVKLNLGSKLYPKNDSWSTDNTRFYHMQIGDFDADNDTKYSYLIDCVNKYNDKAREDKDKEMKLDDSNFIISWDLAYGPFMAVNTEEDNINIEFTGEIITKLQGMYGINAADTNYNNELPSPQIWFTKDTCWKLNMRDGLQFCHRQMPVANLHQDKPDIHYM